MLGYVGSSMCNTLDLTPAAEGRSLRKPEARWIISLMSQAELGSLEPRVEATLGNSGTHLITRTRVSAVEWLGGTHCPCVG